MANGQCAQCAPCRASLPGGMTLGNIVLRASAPFATDSCSQRSGASTPIAPAPTDHRESMLSCLARDSLWVAAESKCSCVVPDFTGWPRCRAGPGPRTAATTILLLPTGLPVTSQRRGRIRSGSPISPVFLQERVGFILLRSSMATAGRSWAGPCAIHSIRKLRWRRGRWPSSDNAPQLVFSITQIVVCRTRPKPIARCWLPPTAFPP